MKATPRLLVLSVMALAVASEAFAGHTHMPNSTWKLNVAESDFGEGPKMKSDTYAIHADDEKKLAYDDTTVDGDGKTWKTSWSGPQDGTSHPLKGMPGATYSSKTVDDTSRFVMPDGTVLDSALSISSDKKKVTLKVDGKMKDGKVFHQTLVYDRVK